MKVLKVLLVGAVLLSNPVTGGVVAASGGTVSTYSSHTSGYDRGYYRISTLPAYFSGLEDAKVYEKNGKRFMEHKSLGELEVLSVKGNLVYTKHSSTGQAFYLQSFKDKGQ